MRHPARFIATLTWLAALAALPAAAQAPRPPGALVFATDAAQAACVVRQREPNGGYDVLALGSCDSPSALFLFDEAARRIRPAGEAALCLSDTTGAGAAPFALLLRPCAEEGVGQFYTLDRQNNRLLSLNGDNRPDRDSFCAFVGRATAGALAPIQSAPCGDRLVRGAHSRLIAAAPL